MEILKLLLADPWAAVLISIPIFALIIFKLITRNGKDKHQEYEGPERRKSMRTLQSELEKLKAGVARNEQAIQHLKEDMGERVQSVHSRFDRLENYQRNNDTQTSRELGVLTEAVTSLQMIISRKGGFRDTPPDGNVFPERKSE